MFFLFNPLFWFILVPLGIWLATCIFTVPQKHEALVARFGRYIGYPKQPGLRFKFPWPIDIVQTKVPNYIQQIQDHLSVKTHDNLFVSLPIAIQFEVRDSEAYYFNTHEPDEQITAVVNAAVRSQTSDKDFQSLYDDKDNISVKVVENTKGSMAEYGVVLRRVVIDEPQATQDVQTAYNRVRASEREKDAAKNEAEADYIRNVKAAEADKARNELIGQGVRTFRKEIAEGYAEVRKELIAANVDADAADEMMQEMMYLDTLRDIGERGNLIIVAPSEAGQTLSAMQTIGAVREKRGE